MPFSLTTLTLQSLLFLDFLASSFSDFPCFFGAFSLCFPRISGVLPKKNLAFFSGVPLHFFNKQGLEGQGTYGYLLFPKFFYGKSRPA